MIELAGERADRVKSAIGSAASTAAHRIVYNPVTGALLYDADGEGGGAAIQFAMLDNHPPTLAATDFVVI
ncbi:hypothetical protein [Sphingosinicella sp. CPCC 101087]|uniref:hypothetical protein n=1 Tax=Sphingosinicella sp. CPCC 101087 TaxID=2497754 RepID=UPI00101CE167|nr:hypothetical protein [Sphingosinicella sp. CPCC 101087]